MPSTQIHNAQIDPLARTPFTIDQRIPAEIDGIRRKEIAKAKRIILAEMPRTGINTTIIDNALVTAANHKSKLGFTFLLPHDTSCSRLTYIASLLITIFLCFHNRTCIIPPYLTGCREQRSMTFRTSGSYSRPKSTSRSTKKDRTSITT